MDNTTSVVSVTTRTNVPNVPNVPTKIFISISTKRRKCHNEDICLICPKCHNENTYLYQHQARSTLL
ncbi:MAG: hypothetical protein ACJ797_01310 [Ktedonobacteraceae bacterium]